MMDPDAQSADPATPGARSFTMDGCRLHYWDVGTGPAVVLTHGAGADHHMFDAQLPFLAEHGYRAISWDQRLHGASRPGGRAFTTDRALADLKALLAHLELRRPVLLGQSFGANLSQRLVHDQPARFRALIVIGAACNTGRLSAKDRLHLRMAAPLLRLVPSGRLPGMMADASAVHEEARTDLARALSMMSKAEFLQVWAATVGLLHPEPGYRTPIPLCLIRGEHDATGTIAATMLGWAADEGTEETVIPDAGHVANADAPEAVNARLLDFLTGLPS